MIFEYKTKEDRDRVYCNLLIELSERLFKKKLLEIRLSYKEVEIEFCNSTADDTIGVLTIHKSEYPGYQYDEEHETEQNVKEITISFWKYDDWNEVIDFTTFFTVCEIIEFLKIEAVKYGVTKEEEKKWREKWIKK